MTTRDPIHPGESLPDDSDALGMTVAELARRSEAPPNRITEILNARPAVTGDTALRLRRFFASSGVFSLNLQTLYELRCAERKHGAAIARLPTPSSGNDERPTAMTDNRRPFSGRQGRSTPSAFDRSATALTVVNRVADFHRCRFDIHRFARMGETRISAHRDRAELIDRQVRQALRQASRRRIPDRVPLPARPVDRRHQLADRTRHPPAVVTRKVCGGKPDPQGRPHPAGALHLGSYRPSAPPRRAAADARNYCPPASLPFPKPSGSRRRP